MGLIPAWKVEIDGRDITERLRDRLLSLKVSDGKHARQDTASITLIDDPPVDWPLAGRTAKIWMGWDDELEEMGEYQVAAPESKGPPASLSIAFSPIPPPRPRTGLAGVDYQSLGSSTFSYADEGHQLDKWARRAGEDLGLRVVIHGDIGDRIITATQQNETHGKFWDRQARELGLTVRVHNGDLIIAPAHTTTSARTGRELPTITIAREDVEDWSGTLIERSTTRRVAARWFDPARGLGGESSSGSGSPARTLPRVYPTEAAATQATQAALRRARAGGAVLDLSVRGDTRLRAHARVNLSEAMRPGLDGTYQINTAEHEIAGLSYVTNIKCEQAL